MREVAWAARLDAAVTWQAPAESLEEWRPPAVQVSASERPVKWPREQEALLPEVPPAMRLGAVAPALVLRAKPPRARLVSARELRGLPRVDLWPSASIH